MLVALRAVGSRALKLAYGSWQKLGGVLFRGPYLRDPHFESILGITLSFGNSHSA